MEKEVRIEVRQCSVPEFCQLPPHPCQRDTEEHATFAERRYLKESAPTHAMVATVVYNGMVYKLDGHTRAYMWTNRGLARPAMLNDVRYYVETLGDFEDLYYMIDEKQQGKTPRATLDGVVHAAGYRFEAELLKKNTYMMAVYAAMNGTFDNVSTMDYKQYSSLSGTERRHAIREVLSQWGELFNIIDEIGPKASHGWKSPVLAAMFMSIRRYGRKIIPFWVGVVNDEGWHAGGLKDGVQTACDKIRDSIHCKKDSYATVTAQLLTCVDSYLCKEYLTHHVRSVKLPAWHQKMLAEPMPLPAIPGLTTTITAPASIKVEEAPAHTIETVFNVSKTPANVDVLRKLHDGDISYKEAEKLTGQPKSRLVRQLKKMAA
jgi:hypothetical protein